MEGPIRAPAVAGQFYPGTGAALVREIEAAYLSPLGPGRLPEVNAQGPRRILGLVCPHAGYVYSGPVAAHSYYHLAADGLPPTVVVLGFSHRPLGLRGALQTSGAWRTPLGLAAVDAEAASQVAQALPELLDDARALAEEHSLEVQLPFLQHLYGESLRFVPVMLDRQDWATARAVGEGLGQALAGREVVVVASTDMSHYVPAPLAQEQDLHLADYLTRLDAEGLVRERDRRGITMCGPGVTAAMLVAARAWGARQGEVLAYHHSGEVAHMAEVVGYLAAQVVR